MDTCAYEYICDVFLDPCIVVAHEVRLLVFVIFNTNMRKFVSACAEDPRHSAQLSAGVRVEQPRNSSEKVKFSVSCTVYRYICKCACVSVCIYTHKTHNKHSCKHAPPHISTTTVFYSFTRAETLIRTCPCAIYVWLLYYPPISSQDGLDSLQLALVVFSYANLPIYWYAQAHMGAHCNLH